MSAVNISNLSYTYPDGTIALKDIDLTIESEKKVALLGSNGSGKTTLMYHLNGLYLPQKGSVSIFDNLVKDSELKSIRKEVGLVFDNPDNQLFATTVYEDVAFGPRNLKLEEALVTKKVHKALEAVEMLSFIDRPPYNLSLGQKKKIAIAGVLAMDPKLLIFDEPFSGLDPISSFQLESILENLYHEKRTILISTHDVDFAYRWADEVIILHQGKLLAKGDTSLLTKEDLMKEALLMIPTLSAIFKSSKFTPRTVIEANDILLKLIKSNG